MTAVRAFSAVRRGSRKAGKYEPLRSFGMASSIRPARVSQPARGSRSGGWSGPGVRAPRRGAGELLDLGRHQPLGGKGQQLADQVRVGALLDQLQQRHSLVGHRRLRLVPGLATRTFTEDRR